ncbi:MAG: IspD/TarI family cytidylyltransferase [Planctomycetota bacterium]|nr:IspD/TarI family cytidylyltransferase [Planctomycetota bacterium]
MSEMRVCLIVTAAGQSARFGSDKLGEDMGGRPVLLRSVEPFTKRNEVVSILVAAPPHAIDSFKGRFGPTLSFHGAIVIAGGATDRWETVQLALAQVPADCTHVAIHDGARPCVSEELIGRVFDAAKVAAAVIPGVRVRDTVKRVSEASFAATEDDTLADAILGDAGKESAVGHRVEETVSRERLMLIQTPQVFERGLIERAYAQSNLEGTTDDASLVERLGEAVLVVDGDPRNIKITDKFDLAQARLLAGLRAPADRPSHLRF